MVHLNTRIETDVRKSSAIFTYSISRWFKSDSKDHVDSFAVISFSFKSSLPTVEPTVDLNDLIKELVKVCPMTKR